MEYSRVLMAVAACLAATTALASVDYTGYSGAPGSRGLCAGDCHGSSGGTITVSGFPSNYTAGQSYVITVEHNGGSSIANFNASVRVGTGSQTAGTLTAGTGTEIYSATGEPMGVHFSSSNRNSGTFTWTAPNPAVGPVKLYLAGHQGSYNGPNTEIQLTSQGAGISEAGTTAGPRTAFTVQPTLATGYLVLRAQDAPVGAMIRITDRAGRVVDRFAATEGQALVWLLRDRDGRRLAAGTYHAVLVSGSDRQARRFTVP